MVADNKPSGKQIFQRNRVYFYSKRLAPICYTVDNFLFHHKMKDILTQEEEKLVKEIHENLKYLHESRKLNYYRKKKEIFKEE